MWDVKWDDVNGRANTCEGGVENANGGEKASDCGDWVALEEARYALADFYYQFLELNLEWNSFRVVPDQEVELGLRVFHGWDAGGDSTTCVEVSLCQSLSLKPDEYPGIREVTMIIVPHNSQSYWRC